MLFDCIHSVPKINNVYLKKFSGLISINYCVKNILSSLFCLDHEFKIEKHFILFYAGQILSENINYKHCGNVNLMNRYCGLMR